MVPEAKLENGVPQSGGWFVVNAHESRWLIVGAGTEPALVLAAGARKGQATYPFDEAAVRQGAGVEQATDIPAEAYARFSRPEDGPAPELP